MLRVLQYQTVNGRTPLGEWLDSLADRQARTRILGRLDRLSAGLLGDWKPAKVTGDELQAMAGI